MSEAKHTPTPWRVGAIIQEGAIRIEAEDGPYVAAVRFSQNRKLGKTLALGNAQFIVRAVNCHDELVAAVERLMAKFDAGTLALMSPAQAVVHAETIRLCGREHVADLEAILATVKDAHE